MVSRSGQAARFSEDKVRAMGRDTSGVRGMNVKQPGNALLAMDVARDDQELLVVTENGYGKRTPISEYPAKDRDTMGVKTITLTENKGALAGALVVREHQELVFISQNGMVQRTSVRGINRYGRASQGVKVMNIRDDDQVSAVALVAESDSSEVADGLELGGDELLEGGVLAVDVDDAPSDDTEAPSHVAEPADDAEARRRRTCRRGRVAPNAARPGTSAPGTECLKTRGAVDTAPLATTWLASPLWTNTAPEGLVPAPERWCLGWTPPRAVSLRPSGRTPPESQKYCQTRLDHLLSLVT